MTLLSKNIFRSAALGLGALAMVSAANIGIPSQAHAEDARPAISATKSGFENVMPASQATQQRPYSHMRFDAETQRNYPDFGVPNALYIHSDKLVVLNFIDESSQYSAMQTQVLEQTLTALAPRSQDKELMLMDVVVTDANGNDINIPTYAAYIENNQLGPNGSSIDTLITPYGLAWGEPLAENGDNRLFDFALLNGVKNDADLNANANAITGALARVVNTYNQKKVVAE